MYFMYLDARIARGYFREQGMLEEFVIFNRIMIKYKKLLLKVYETLSYQDAYHLLLRLNYEFFYPFIFEEYLDIRIE